MTQRKLRVTWPILASYLAGLATAGLIAILVAAASAPTPAIEPPATASAPPTTNATSSWPTASSSAPTTAPSTTTSSTTASAVTSQAADVPQHSAVPLTPEARGRIAPLEARLAADPSDLASRKQLAVVLLQSQQLMLAYQHASQILAANADDPDGLYIHGVVRLAMGHAPRAIELLDRVLVRYPEHALALQARADAQRKIGDETGAALTAARAREAAQGSNPDVDQLLAAVSDGTLFEMIRGSDPATAANAVADAGGK